MVLGFSTRPPATKAMSISLKEIAVSTDEFFKLHWLIPGETPPEWSSEPYTGTGFIPFGKLPGCYALLRGVGEVVYIGSGVSRGSARYQGWGLAARLRQYTRRDPAAGDDRWSFRYGHTGVHTIGFPPNRAYLVLALEMFLISRFSDLKNKKRTLSEDDQNAEPAAPPNGGPATLEL
jgi:hypothetical protein